MGSEIRVELSYHTCGSWYKRLEKHPPSLVCNGFAKEIIDVVKPLLLDEGPILRDEAEFLGRTLVDKFRMIIIRSGLFTCPNFFELSLCFFLDIGHLIESGLDGCLSSDHTLLGVPGLLTPSVM